LHKDLEECLATGRVDVIVSVLKEEKRMGVERQKLLDVPLVLAVPQESSLNSAADILKEDTIRHPLICLPEDEWITSRFLQELEAKGKTWLPSIEVRSLELLRKFVLEGYGVGLSVAVPGEQHTGMKIFSLDEFSPVPIGISWRSKTPPVQALIAETISLARALAPGKK
jgi:DNA-binding transcriptional LysR family regulator